MINKGKWYEEFEKSGLNLQKCSGDKLKETLADLGEWIRPEEDILIFQVESEECSVWYKKTGQKEGKDDIRIDLAVKFRVELDLSELDTKMQHLDDILLESPFVPITGKYSHIRYMNLQDDFLIMDVYVGVREKGI